MSVRRMLLGVAPRALLFSIAVLLLLATAAEAQASTPLPTTISTDTTLTAAASPYTGSDVTVASGVTLTAEPGATVKLSGRLTVNGTLDVNGTAADPVLFTSASDSAPKQWYGISLNTGSSSIDRAEIRYSRDGVVIAGGTAPSISNSLIRDNAWRGISSTAGSSPTITDNTIRDNGMEGIYVSAGGSPEIARNAVDQNALDGIEYSASSSSHQGTVKIHDNTLDGNGADGIRVATTFSSVQGGTLEGNQVTGSAEQAIDYISNWSGSLPPDIDDNPKPTGNGSNAIWLGGDLEQSAIWEDRDYPLVIYGGSVAVKGGATLTLDPGLVVKNQGASSVDGLYVEGELNATGTSANPIIFTSVHDDSIAGDTNDNGAATQPAPGDWDGIQMATQSTASTVEHVEVGYGRHGITTNAQTLHVKNSVAHDNAWNGFEIRGGSPAVKFNVADDNGMSGINFAGQSGAPEIAFNTVRRNYLSGPTTSGGGINFEVSTNRTATVNIHDNVSVGNGSAAGIRVWQSSTNTQITAVSLGANEVRDSAGKALYYQSFGPVPADLPNNPTPTGNGSDAIWVSGDITADMSWHDRFPFVVIGGYDLDVAAGATLTLDPGAVVKPDGISSDINVGGALLANGTAQQPVTITSLKDDSVGGDTNGDGAASAPVEKDWGGVYFSGGGTGTLDHARLSYGGRNWRMVSVACPCPSPPLIKNSRLTDSTYALYVTGTPPSGAPDFARDTRFLRNSSYAIYKGGTGSIDARFNDYGCESGPQGHGGCGGRVSNNVNWQPHAAGEEKKCNGGDHQCGEGGDPVSLAEGIFTYSHSDLTLSNGGDPLAFARSYNSGDDSDSGLGPGWAHIGLLRASEVEPDGDVLVRRADGRVDRFTRIATGYDPPSGIHDVLEKSGGGTFTLTTPDGVAYEFDSTTRIDRVVDEHGLVTDYSYDSSGLLTAITDHAGQSLTFTHDASNHITKVADSTGREVSFGYSAAGRLRTVTDPLGEVTTYGYDGGGRLETITDPRGITYLDNDYDGQDRVIGQTDGEGNFWQLAYSAGQTIVTEPEGGQLTFQFDSEDRVSSQTDQLGQTTSYSYDADGNVNQISRPGGAIWLFSYDSSGNLLSRTDPEGGSESWTYNNDNRPTTYTDARNKTWSYTWTGPDLTKITDPAAGEIEIAYSASGQPSAITDERDNTTTLAYDSRGNLTSATDPLSNATAYGYDAQNQLTSITEPGKAPRVLTRNGLGDLLSDTSSEGYTTSFGYDENGGLTSITDPALNTWTIARDGMERPTTITDPLNQSTQIVYDGNLNPVSVTDRRSKTTTYSYDLANQLTRVKLPEGGEWDLGYDARGNRDELIDPNNHTTTYDHDLADRMTAVHEPLNTDTLYDYDAAGNLAQITDPRGNQTAFARDALGQITALNQPLGKQTTFAYDSAGNTVSRDNGEEVVDISYDELDRPTEISSSASTVRAFSYDAAGRLTTATDAQADTIAFTYDDDDRIVGIDDGRGQTVSRSFNDRGLLSSQTDGRGTIGYTYDGLGRMTSLTDPASQTIDFDYDPEGNLTETVFPNGITRTASYDGDGRSKRITATIGPTVIDDRSYSHDPTGNRTAFVDERLAETTTYAHDALNRLTEFDPPGAPAVGYAFDGAGNRTQAGGKTFSYNSLNQLTSDSSGATYSYDDAGRLIGEADGSATTSYAYDSLDQLVQVDDGGAIDYTMDSLGRRAERTEGPAVSSAHYGDTTDLAILDTDGSGTVTDTYVHGPGGLVEHGAGASVSFPLPDAHGDITTRSDSAGAVESRHSYDPWGEHLTGPDLEFGWLGAYQRRGDFAAGLVRMGARGYSPEGGRFVTEDPVVAIVPLSQSLDRYTYVLNAPVKLYDLAGREVDLFGGLVFEPRPWEWGGDPREMISEAQDYWVGSDSPVAPFAGPLVTEVDFLLNPESREMHVRNAHLFWKNELDFAGREAIANTFAAVGGSALCEVLRGPAGRYGITKQLAATCLTATAIGAAGLGVDLGDEDNSLWTDHAF